MRDTLSAPEEASEPAKRLRLFHSACLRPRAPTVRRVLRELEEIGWTGRIGVWLPPGQGCASVSDDDSPLADGYVLFEERGKKTPKLVCRKRRLPAR